MASESTPLTSNPSKDEQTPLTNEDTPSPLTSKDEQTPPPHFWRTSLLCGLPYLLWSTFYSAIVPMMPFYAEQMRLSEVAQATILAILQVGFLSGLWCSSLADSAGVSLMKQVRVAALCSGLGAALLTIPRSPPLWLFLSARVLEGFGSAIQMANLDFLLAQSIPSHFIGRAVGVKMALGGFGHLYGPLLCGMLYESGGIRLPMIFVAVVALGAFAAYCLYVPVEPKEGKSKASGPESLYARFRAAWGAPSFAPLMAQTFFCWVLMGSIWFLVPLELVAVYHLTPQQITLAWAVSNLTMMLFSVLGGVLADKLPPALCMQALQLLQGGLCCALSQAKSAPGVIGLTIALFAVGTAASGLLGPQVQKLLAQCTTEAQPEVASLMYKINGALVAFAIILGNVLSAVLSQSSVSFQLTTLGTGLVLLAGYGTLAFLSY